MSIFYLLFLTFLTWTCIELHGRNFKLLVMLWRPFHKCFVRLQRKWDTKHDIVDVFASFFLLFYTKHIYLASVLYRCFPLKYTQNGINYNKCVNIDGHISRQKYVFLVIPLVVVFNILPVLVLVLYPFKLFRACLSKCKLDKLFLTTFVEKFHGCYRDGLSGGRDMRSFSCLYCFLIFLVSHDWYHLLHVRKLNISYWLYAASIFLTFSLLIALVKPYKQNYMNILDTLLLAHLAIVCGILSRDYFSGDETQLFVVLLIPVFVFGLFFLFKIHTKFKNSLRLVRHCKCYNSKQEFHCDSKTAGIQDQKQLISPTSTVIDIQSYGSCDN